MNDPRMQALCRAVPHITFGRSALSWKTSANALNSLTRCFAGAGDARSSWAPRKLPICSLPASRTSAENNSIGRASGRRTRPVRLYTAGGQPDEGKPSGCIRSRRYGWHPCEGALQADGGGQTQIAARVGGGDRPNPAERGSARYVHGDS